MTSRLGVISEAASQLPSLRSDLHARIVWPDWPPPDRPSDTVLRALDGHAGVVRAVAVARDGAWAFNHCELLCGGGLV